MCSNYEPPQQDSLAKFGHEPPAQNYAMDAYPMRAAPFLANSCQGQWLIGCFGLVPHWAEPKLARSTYNARSETVAEKPSFRTAWKRRQFAIIPAAAIYEPNYESGRPVRWRIARADGATIGLAGIYEHRVGDHGLTAWSFSMLTINADGHPLMSRFHGPGDEKRSVVVLEHRNWGDWLNASSDDQARALLQPMDPDLMTSHAAPRPPRSKAQQ